MLEGNLKSQFDSLLPGASTESGATRRTALKVALGVGYAATAMPIMAQTAIKTSSDGGCLRAPRFMTLRANRSRSTTRSQLTKPICL